jgi:hypothetical protein
MKTILTSELKHKKIIFWVGLQGVGVLLLLGWILSWVLAPTIGWLDILFMVLSILQIGWTCFELLYKRFKKNENTNRWSWFKDIRKYSWTEMIINWIIIIWLILFLSFYISIICVYWHQLYLWVNRLTIFWPLPDWIMWILGFSILIWMAVWSTKFYQIWARHSTRKKYKTIQTKREERLKKLMSGTSDGTFSGIVGKAPKGFN